MPRKKPYFHMILASLYPSCVRTPVHRHCLLHVKKLRNSVSTFFFTHINKVLVKAHIISQFWMKRGYQHIFSWAATFDRSLLLEFLHPLQHY